MLHLRDAYIPVFKQMLLLTNRRTDQPILVTMMLGYIEIPAESGLTKYIVTSLFSESAIGAIDQRKFGDCKMLPNLWFLF